jgi:ketosteroid isomerase-like protein
MKPPPQKTTPKLDEVEAEVLAANDAFYAAFAAGDAQAMDALWARASKVACIHPGWDALIGRAKVMASWRAILGGAGGAEIEHSGDTVHVLGDAAFVICQETIEGARLVATNTFVREGPAWKMAHHHAAPVARRLADEESDDDDEADEEPPPGALN